MTNYYVSPSGSNANPGTQASPWATLSHALQTVQANQGHVIYLFPGIYDLGTEILQVKSGTAITSADTNNWATIQGSLAAPVGSQDIILWRLKFEGKNATIPQALYMGHVSGLYIEELDVSNYRDGFGLFFNLTKSTKFPKNHLGRLKIRNCCYSNRVAGQQGTYTLCMRMGDVQDFYVHDIDADTRQRGGEFLGTMKESWTAENHGSTPSLWKNVKIFNNKIFVDDYTAWNNGYSPQICVEAWCTDSQDVEIFNNHFNNNISLASGHNLQQIGLRVHNNLWLAEKADKPFYAIEVSQANIKAYENLVIGGIYAFANFADGSAVCPGIEIYKNIVDSNNAGGSPIGFNIATSGSVKFYNNTFISRSNTNIGYFYNPNTGTEAKNNIFVCFNANVQSGFLNNQIVSNNLFSNVQPLGNNQVNGNPSLRFTAGEENTVSYYQLNANSPAINVGIAIAGYTDGYEGSAPDLGALEYGKVPFKVGINAVGIPSDVIINPLTGETVGSGSSIPPIPANIAIASVGSDNATVNWSQSGTVTNWYVAYKKDTDADWSYLQTAQPSITLTGLSASSTYYVAVCACNGNACSSYSSVVSFATTTGSTATMATINVYSSNGGSQTLLQAMNNIALDPAGAVNVTLPVT